MKHFILHKKFYINDKNSLYKMVKTTKTTKPFLFYVKKKGKKPCLSCIRRPLYSRMNYITLLRYYYVIITLLLTTTTLLVRY